MQRSSWILISIAVTATIITCLILPLERPRIRGMETWPKTSPLVCGEDQFSSTPGLSACTDHTLNHCLLIGHHRGQRPAWDLAEWQEGSHPGMDISSGQSPYRIIHTEVIGSWPGPVPPSISLPRQCQFIHKQLNDDTRQMFCA